MLRIILHLFISFCSLSVFSQGLIHNWSASFGGNNYETGTSCVDAIGNVYSVGTFGGTADFAPGTSVYNLTSNGNDDVFIQKLDSNGSLQWVYSIGGSSQDRGVTITTDGSNIYLAGTYSGTVDFNPSSATNTMTSVGTDIFILKLTTGGVFVWAKSLSGNGSKGVSGIEVDGSGNVYTNGFYTSSIDFDPGAGTQNISASGDRDVFVSKLDANGNYVWAKCVGGSGDDRALGFHLDANNNLYSTGYFTGTVDFDPGTGTSTLAAGIYIHGFVQKLNSSGNLVWAKSMGGAGICDGIGITTDGQGDLLVSGFFIGLADFNPGSGTFSLNGGTSADAFVLKWSSSGTFEWVKAFVKNGNGPVSSNAVVCDMQDNIYVVGQYQGSADFDPGNDTVYMTSNGQYDLYIVKLDSDGDYLWSGSAGGSGHDFCSTVIPINSTQLHLSGSYESTFDLDFQSTSQSYSSEGATDFYVVRYKFCSAEYSALETASCNSYTSPSGNHVWTSSGIYEDTLTNIFGCDSIVEIDLTIHEDQTTNLSIESCDEYTWAANNQSYTSSGSYQETLSTSNGCDSVVTLDLTINNSAQSSDSIHECLSYFWEATGQTYSISGTYTANLFTQSGCDSVVTLDLELDQVDASFSQDSLTLIAVSSQSSYQWIRCDSGNALIPGATDSTFVVTQTGTYAVIVENGLCTDTSACLYVDLLGNDVVEREGSFFMIYPNPSTGGFRIQGAQETLAIQMFNQLGQQVYNGTAAPNEEVNPDIPAGHYILKMTSERGDSSTVRWMKL